MEDYNLLTKGGAESALGSWTNWGGTTTTTDVFDGSSAFLRNSASAGGLAQRIPGRTGGKFYALADHRNIANRPLPGGGQQPPDSAAYRKFLLVGTHNPITFYGLNVERGGEKRDAPQPAPFAEFIGCRNVRILGAKTEPDTGPAFSFRDCRNVSLVGLNTHRETGHPLLQLLGDCQDVELAQIGNRTNARTNLMIEPVADILEQDLLVLFRQGTFDHNAF